MRYFDRAFRQNLAVLIYAIALFVIVVGVFLTSITWSEDRALKWIGALSGWAAAIAAGGTIFVLLRQLSEQKQQYNFISGNIPLRITWELDPDYKFHDIPDWIAVNLINMSNRPIRVIEIRIIGGPDDLMPSLETHSGKSILASENGEETIFGRLFTPHFSLDGWFNKNDEPPQITLKMLLMRATTTSYALEKKENFSVEVDYLMLDDIQKRKTAKTNIDTSNSLYWSLPTNAE